MNPVNPSVAGMKSKADWNHHKGERVTNNNMVDSCKLRPGEDYSTVFRHKVEDRPTLSTGCHVCHKFQNKGFCYKYCDNASSHCKLVNNDFTFMDNRIKVLHGKWFFGQGSRDVLIFKIAPNKYRNVTTRYRQFRFSDYKVTQRSEICQENVPVNLNSNKFGSTLSKIMEGKYFSSLMISDPSTVSLPSIQDDPFLPVTLLAIDNPINTTSTP